MKKNDNNFQEKIYIMKNLKMQRLFLYLALHFIKLKKKYGNIMEYMIYFNYLNCHCLNIIITFKYIIKIFTKSQKELKIINKQSINIGKSLESIFDMIYSSYDSKKIKKHA